MSISKFSEYYLNSLIKDPNKDYIFDGSDEWFKDHTAITSKGSLAIGITEEHHVTNFRNFLDIQILPEIFEVIKKNQNTEIVFISKETDTEIYIYESICKKFPQKQFINKKASENIQRDIRILELENKIAISVLESNKIFSIKNLIEYI
jgi:hypothetical protein